nr:DUF2878 domain-containing protein [Pseudomaricurvus alcaniphilus]
MCRWSWPNPVPEWSNSAVKAALNGLLFQLGWLVAVQGSSRYALLATAVLLVLHWCYWSRSRREWGLIMAVAAAGYAIDSVLVWQGVFLVAGNEWVAPLWLLCIWVMFATTLCHAFAFLQRNLGLAMLLGAVFPPFSYWAGEKLAPLEFSDSVIALGVLAVIWAILLPLLALSARHVEEGSKQ